MGWFYCFRFHLIINKKGDILCLQLTPGNTDDRSPLPDLATGLHGTLYGDKGYISKDVREMLRQQGINSVYKVRKNMKPEPLSASDEMWLRKRVIIESVIKELKHRRSWNTVGIEVSSTFK